MQPQSGIAHSAQTQTGRGSESNVSSELMAKIVSLYPARTTAGGTSNAVTMPTCAPPQLPVATNPPGHSYGVPFLAAITGGHILSGYDEWTANHHVWKLGSKTYDLNPWQANLFDITGWVTGLLQLPSLNVEIPPQDIVFCDQGGASCVSASPPPGQCIHISLGGAPTPGQPPPPVITNVPPPGKVCLGNAYHKMPCIPYLVTLTPVGTTSLTVSGVEADGALDLRVTTSAVTTVSILVGTTPPICQNSATTITLSTQAPSNLPPGAPIPPKPGNPDERGLQTAPQPLTGPLASSTSTVATNDFSVPAFPLSSACTFAATLNAPLAGWNAITPNDPASENNNYYDKPTAPADAGTPGWDQFSAATTVATLGLPVGPPAGFSF